MRGTTISQGLRAIFMSEYERNHLWAHVCLFVCLFFHKNQSGFSLGLKLMQVSDTEY